MVVFKEKPFIFHQKYDDALLVSMANNGNTLAEYCLINRYKKLVRMKTRTYFLIGADKEDIIQEGMIGLYKAVRNYDNSKYTSFRVFAEICIMRQIITAIKKSSRKKRTPPDSCVSLNQPIEYEEGYSRTLLDIVDDLKINDPMSIFLSKERLQELTAKLNTVLSNLERKVLSAYLDGKTYRDIAFEIQKNSKCVDNAIQRIKKKLEFINK
ncbi:MAG: RNA polymerase sporulation sigma factor SigH [Atribacterota bacterium]|nr:RNA polymerase sporulation sigma factor SigH [Atribacterota bacterium]MDY0382582.1 RNA polymerase sporulation sigma factor SigH [Atribacterota bacterium]